MRNSVQILFYTFLALCFITCASKRGRKVYKILTTEQANKIHKYYTVKKPKDWSIYIEGHGMLIYSPLGTDIWKKYTSADINNTILRKKEAKVIFDYNKKNKLKKGVL